MFDIVSRLIPIALLALAACRATAPDRTPEPVWWKGNTHAHSLWSDGTAAPEVVVAWYKEHGYSFLVLTEHDLIAEGERWIPVGGEGDDGAGDVDARSAAYGSPSVAQRDRGGRREIRLATLDELSARYDAPERFLLMRGEEITGRLGMRPVHVNAIDLTGPIAPRTGGSVREVLLANVNAVLDQARTIGRPVVPQVNHPNYRWSLTAGDLAALPDGCLFEVYNGHPESHNEGDAEHPSTEALWDRALAARYASGAGPIWGVASDDSHDFAGSGEGNRSPGRGWVVVRSKRLRPRAIAAALARGDFYSSTGVELVDVRPGKASLEVEIALRTGESAHTRFIGTRAGAEEAAIGVVLAESDANPAVYQFRGDELYVRAVVELRAGDVEGVERVLGRAWVQPCRPGDSR